VPKTDKSLARQHSASEREEQLRWERRRAPAAAAGAMAGAILPMAGAAWGAVLTSDDRSTELTGRLLFVDGHTTQLLLAAGIQALGALAFILPLTFLYRAATFRREVPRVAGLLTVLGPLLYGLSQIGFQIALSVQGDAFAATSGRTYEEAKNLFEAPGVVAIRYFGLVAGLTIATAFVLASLHAMRAGLLTRFMGFLGVIVGALFVIPLFGQGPPVVQSFWLAALAALFMGRWPSGVPPAWREGREVPWPTRQEMIERAQREREERDGVAAGEPEPATAAGPSAAAPRTRAANARKRKRKKRR
jgi:hypothetical protein